MSTGNEYHVLHRVSNLQIYLHPLSGFPFERMNRGLESNLTVQLVRHRKIQNRHSGPTVSYKTHLGCGHLLINTRIPTSFPLSLYQ